MCSPTTCEESGDTRYSLDEIPVDRRDAEVRRTAGLRLPDALIAATALIHELPLRTRNVDDFRRVPGLRVR
jgi:predicted nucleic acid-binding protein